MSPTSNPQIFSPVNGAQSNGWRRALTNTLQWKIIRLDILKCRYFSLDTVRQYGGKLAAYLRENKDAIRPELSSPWT